jgi:glucose-1-phosphate thymidylyltransferase
MKGILLAGVHAARRLPLLLEDEPPSAAVGAPLLLDLSLAVLLQAGVREICIVASAEQTNLLHAEHGDGSRLGLHLSYELPPSDLSTLFAVRESWLAGQSVVVVQGDILLSGDSLSRQLRAAARRAHGASVFAHALPPSASPPAKTQASGKRPTVALCGVSFFDDRVGVMAHRLPPLPLPAGLLELQRSYLREGTLEVIPLDPGILCMDCSASESLLALSLFMQTWEQTTGHRLACLEEIALQQGTLDLPTFERLLLTVDCPEKRLYLQRALREATPSRRRAA